MSDIFEDIADNWLYLPDRAARLQQACSVYQQLVYLIPAINIIRDDFFSLPTQIRILFVFNNFGCPKLRVEFTFYCRLGISPILKIETADSDSNKIQLSNIDYSAHDIAAIVNKIISRYSEDYIRWDRFTAQQVLDFINILKK